ncbi:MAG: ribosomal-protein-alanine N-acetyltransferase [Candidatus Eisenbacteria bacterium]|nr:ribosomal-protein-alanine N-acetyltransferase [Candidatus Latescibacterota bacterium]MBD3301568.1 ribosomal-protein-alanine N-acetyltransferase [Candidatus Eisenbacteria bacterium]
MKPMRESRERDPEVRSGEPEAPGPGAGEPSWDPMTAGDVAEVAALERLCFEDPWSPASFAAEVKPSHFGWPRILRVGGRLAGYLIAWFVEDEAHLANIAVAPWARGRGYAQRMLDHLRREAYLRGCRIIALEVRSSNRVAVRLYEKNGFLSCGTRRDYYSRPREDALMMVLPLGLQENEE